MQRLGIAVLPGLAWFALGCAHSPVRMRPGAPTPVATTDHPCGDCASIPFPAEVTQAVEARIADLRSRGGDCATYGAVLDSSYKSGRIILRAYMWRVGPHLAAGEGKPSGEMTLARDIDSLNVGVRSIDEITHTMEHEAVHIAFEISSRAPEYEAKVNAFVRACRS